MDTIIQVILLIPITFYSTTKNWWNEKHWENTFWDEFWEVHEDYYDSFYKK